MTFSSSISSTTKTVVLENKPPHPEPSGFKAAERGSAKFRKTCTDQVRVTDWWPKAFLQALPHPTNHLHLSAPSFPWRLKSRIILSSPYHVRPTLTQKSFFLTFHSPCPSPRAAWRNWTALSRHLALKTIYGKSHIIRTKEKLPNHCSSHFNRMNV